jgi:O-methyltransferase involved in polyketide biosynthesis
MNGGDKMDFIAKSEKVTLQPDSVQETMLIPLWGRATYSRLYPELLVDPRAEEIIARIDYDYSKIEKALGEYGGIGYLVRARRFDESISRYLTDHPRATVVNLGCGLDTTFSRVDNGQIRWVNIDLDDAISFRKKLIPEPDRSTCLSRSAFDLGWLDEVGFDPDKGIFIIAGGLFMYFEEREVRALFTAMADRFPGGEIHFDTMPKLGTIFINRRLKGTGVPLMKLALGIRNPQRQLRKWSTKLKVVESCAFYHGVPRNPRWDKRIVTMMNMNDRMKTGGFVRVRFEV